MPNLTDSFCERCGARYAFVANAPRGPLRGARVLARGLKYFVLTDGQSIAESMELARTEEDREASSRMTQAFHRTFNFCLSCRQYACDRCWNSTTGECLSCSPESAGEPTVSPAPLTESLPRAAEAAWPAIDLVDDPHAGPSLETTGDGIFVSVDRTDDWGMAGPRPTADWVALETIPTVPAQETAPAPEIAAASEMTLTPEELELVEAQLSHGDVAPHPASEPDAVTMPPLLQERQTWWNAAGPVADDESDAPGWTLDDSIEESRQTPESDLRAAQFASSPADEPAVADESGDTSADGMAPVESRPSTASRILRRTSTTQSLPPLAPPSPRPQAHRPAGLVARLLGRHKPEIDAAPSTTPPARRSRRGRASGDAWPFATPWGERPLEGRHWWLHGDRPAGRSMPEPCSTEAIAPEKAVPATAAEPEPAVDLTPEPAFDVPAAASAEPATGDQGLDRHGRSMPLQAEPVGLDSRSAVALRLSAVESAATPAAEGEGRPPMVLNASAAAGPGQPAPALQPPAEPAVNPRARTTPETAATSPAPDPASTYRPLPDPAAPASARRASPAPEAPLWLRVQREAAEPAPARAYDVPDRRLADGLAAALPVSPSRQAADTPPTQPANQWPPLGARWPSHEQPGAPWPGPDAVALPAVVAALQGSAPTMAEMWVQSSHEVLTRGAVRVCRECTLPISTKARFCRRCGTQQA